MVRVKGLEPSRLSARASKTRVSANFTIPATINMIPYTILVVNSFRYIFCKNSKKHVDELSVINFQKKAVKKC